MDIPESMKPELAAWNDGAGIDLESWIGCVGSLSLAVGYATIFWPEFVLFQGYILRQGFSEASLRGFERQTHNDRRAVEGVMNHLHIADIHGRREDASRDKIVLLGNALKEIYQAKLQFQFPDRPCEVEFFIPENQDADLVEYQLSFWQRVDEPSKDDPAATPS